MVAGLLALLILAGGVLLLTENRLVYYPDPVIHHTPASAGLPYTDVRLSTSDGSVLDGWYVPSPQPHAVVIICHGNAGNISTRIPLLVALHELHLSSFIFDYSGFGRSTGRPTERGTYDDAAAAWQWVHSHVPGVHTGALSIIIMGRSLGGPVAGYLSSIHPPAALVLDSTFPSIASLVRSRAPYLPVRLLLRYRYNTLSFLDRVHCPVLVVHSRDDSVVPISQGRALYAAIKTPKMFLEIRGPHVQGFVADSDHYSEGLRHFLSLVEQDQ